MIHRFLSVAEAELEELVLWYERQQTGLGEKFLDDFDHAIERSRRNPDAWRPMGNGQTRIILRVFQAGLIYRPKENEILTTAVFDLRIDPENWKEILKKRS